MFNATSTYLTKIKEASRIVSAKVDINGTVITENLLIDFSVESSMGSNRMPTIGSSIATKLNLSLIKDVSIPAILINVPIKPYVGIEISTGVVEWIPLGVFYANVGDVIRNKKTIDIECFDRMPDLDGLEYTSTLTFPATIQQMITEIATQHSIIFETQTLPTVSFATKPEGTVRQVITYIASLISRNVVVNRTGKFEFRFTNTIAPATFTFNGDSYVDFSLLSDSMVKISQLSVKVTEDTSIVSGDATGISLVFENPAITSQAILDTVRARVYPLIFNAYTMTCQGFPHVDCGDSVQFTDVDGVVRTIIIGEHKLRYAGGLKSEFKCEAPKEESKDVTITSGSAIKHAVKNFAKTFEGAIKNATNLITGNEGGDLIILSDVNGKPYELVILGDTPVGQVGDIDTAMKVWRWNAGGLGYSSTGYNGSYSTAITSDGQINADFIITGEMSASLVRTGLLSSEDGKTWINLTDGKFSLGNGAITYNGTTLSIDANVDLSSNTSITAKFSQIGGTNLILKSGRYFNSANYLVSEYPLAEPTVIGQTYTYQIKGQLQSGQRWLFYGQDSMPFGMSWELGLYDSAKGIYYATFTATRVVTGLAIYNYPNNGFYSTINWIKFEKGSVRTDWSPHPSELTGATYSFDGDKFKIGGFSGDSVEHTNSLSKYTHSDGSYTQIGVNGMERFVSGTGRKYHYLVHAMTFIQGASGTTRWLQLPDEFKGKQFSIYLAIADTISAESTRNAIQRIVVTKDPAKNIDYANARVPVIAYKTVVDMVSPFTSLISTVQGMLLAIY